MSQPIILIPARMAATRLPGKPLADIHGTPLIVHVWQRAVAAALGPVLVATDDEAIASAITKAGGKSVLTRASHVSGSDRIQEAIEIYDPARRFDIVVNVQGDLPAIAPESIKASLRPLCDPSTDIATLATEIRSEAERHDPNNVKIAAAPLPSGHLRALYFSRAPIPWGVGPLYHHVGIYAYRRAALERFTRLPPSTLEKREKLEQLRALEAGMRIDAALIESCPLGVDTPETLDQAREILRPQ